MTETKYPALEAILRYAAQNGMKEPLYRLASSLDRESVVLALYDLIKYAHMNDFVPEALKRDPGRLANEVDELLEEGDFDELRRMAQTLLYSVGEMAS